MNEIDKQNNIREIEFYFIWSIFRSEEISKHGGM